MRKRAAIEALRLISPPVSDPPVSFCYGLAALHDLSYEKRFRDPMDEDMSPRFRELRVARCVLGSEIHPVAKRKTPDPKHEGLAGECFVKIP